MLRHQLAIAVGTALPLKGSGCPPRRSERAELPHSAPALGLGVEALFGPGMKDLGRWDPAVGQLLHAHPGESTTLTASPESKQPSSFDFLLEHREASAVGRHGVVREVSAHDRAEPPSLFGNAQMSPTHQRVPDASKRCAHPLSYGPPHEEKLPRPGSRTNVRESEEGEGLRCASKILFLTSRSRVATERNQTGLLGMQFERELAHSFAKFREKLHRIGVVLETPQPDASRCAQGAPPVGQLPGAGPAMRSSTIARFVRKRRRTPSSAAAGSRSSIARSMSATMGKRTLRDERS